MKRIFLGAVLAALAVSSASSFADIVTYYVGVDGRSTPFNAPGSLGGGAYPDNPNQGRLTLLLHHGDHYHGIGAWTYSGPAATPVLNDTNANNMLPEGFTGLPAVRLAKGTGNFADKYRSGLPSSLPQNTEYGNFELRNAHSLVGEDDTTFNSSGGRWNGTFVDADIWLELISATSGLNIAFGDMPTMDLTAGNKYALGAGDAMFAVKPTFWVDGGAAAGTYTAEFRLRDMNNASRDSGRFFVNLAVVPEPGGVGLAALGSIVFGAAAWRRSRRRGTLTAPQHSVA